MVLKANLKYHYLNHTVILILALHTPKQCYFTASKMKPTENNLLPNFIKISQITNLQVN